MILFQYDFRIEFYDASNDIRHQKPKLIIETKQGAPIINIVISNEYSLASSLQCKKARLQLFNMPLNFNKSLMQGDIARIYYKKFAHEDDLDYRFIMIGYLGAPVDFDFENGDFICQYEVYLLSSDTFFDKKLDTKNYIGRSLEEAINLAFPGQAIIGMSNQDRKQMISESFYVTTLKEFIQKIIGKYVHLIFVDIGDLDFKVDAKFVFINFDRSVGQRVYKRLEDFALLFIPQREVRFVGKSTISFWNVTLFFTDKIKVGDGVEFSDRYGGVIRAIVQETGASLSNVGDCTLKLRLYDESNILWMG
ncbi:Hypothetical protein BHY_1057 (plasmid) [Borrelia nietonii YOR]|uniref:Uncharacterized protein n=1 Tax=Borrelia nietonii YOR TaxID=1293576 RepID=W5SBC6_9SPIR|nr:DUF693 family protein [Borrelia nietonii]AHH04008.1 Hypothetical protein BHY_1057 [Borrelia nietonii YOR]UPA09839.1 DUF693 family protein [Borrelia nietonii YOR]